MGETLPARGTHRFRQWAGTSHCERRGRAFVTKFERDHETSPRRIQTRYNRVDCRLYLHRGVAFPRGRRQLAALDGRRSPWALPPPFFFSFVPLTFTVANSLRCEIRNRDSISSYVIPCLLLSAEKGFAKNFLRDIVDFLITANVPITTTLFILFNNKVTYKE